MNIKQIIACFLMLGILVSVRSQVVPDQMYFCGMELSFSPAAKRKLGEYISKIYESPRYFNQMVKKADTYMPFVEEAFQDAGVPTDIKFLIIQESGLRADVVSSSQAVGFWQLKRATALEAGLRVDEKVDERMHIYRSSLAAANYLQKGYRDFDNWVYALIAYYEGPTGAVAYTEPRYYGNRRMMITDDLHWYALKAIAHKLAYEEALEMGTTPEIWLEPFSTAGTVNIRKLYAAHHISEEEFLQYNKWMRDVKKLPRDELFTYYIPQSEPIYAGHIMDPTKQNIPAIVEQVKDQHTNDQYSAQFSPDYTSTVSYSQYKEDEQSIVKSEIYEPSDGFASEEDRMGSAFEAMQTEAQDIRTLEMEMYAAFELRYDLHYGSQYVQYDGSSSLVEIANRYGVLLNDLMLWNGLTFQETPTLGSILYLRKPQKALFHIVEEGENLAKIGLRHTKSVAFLQKKNRMGPTDVHIYVGQKLYLKKRKPRNEKLIILTGEAAKVEPKPTIAKANKPEIIADLAINQNPKKETSLPNQQSNINEVQTHWVEHIVQEGESLWKISQQYNTKVEIIKRINKLDTDGIQQGRVLRILARN